MPVCNVILLNIRFIYCTGKGSPVTPTKIHEFCE